MSSQALISELITYIRTLPVTYQTNEKDIRALVKHIEVSDEGVYTIKTIYGNTLIGIHATSLLIDLIKLHHKRYFVDYDDYLDETDMDESHFEVLSRDDWFISDNPDHTIVMTYSPFGFIITNFKHDARKGFNVIALDENGERLTIHYNGVYMTSGEAFSNFHESHFNTLNKIEDKLKGVKVKNEDINYVHYEDGKYCCIKYDGSEVNLEPLPIRYLYREMNKLAEKGYYCRDHIDEEVFEWKPKNPDHRTADAYREYDEEGKERYVIVLNDDINNHSRIVIERWSDLPFILHDYLRHGKRTKLSDFSNNLWFTIEHIDETNEE